MTATAITVRGTHTNDGGRRAGASRLGARGRITLPLLYIYLVWLVAITDVHRWLAERGLHIVAMHQALTVMMVPLLILLVIKLPGMFGRGRPVWYFPLLAFVGSTFVASIGALHWEPAWAQVKILITYYILIVVTLVYVKAPRQVVPLVLLLVGQYWWWGWHSGLTGAVWWHPTYANFDGFGPLVLIGLPLTFFFGLAAKSRMLRYGAFFLGAYSALAMVASLARGVILAGGVVVVVAIIRSPKRQRFRSTVVLLVGIASFLIASSVLVPDGGVWTEVKSAFTEGKDEGTGRDRWDLWTAAMGVWRAHPIIGVGAEQTGFVASRMIVAGDMELDGYYGDNPFRIEGRALHNVWVQILAEFGLVGTALIVWLLVDFWRRNATLRRPEFVEYWARSTNGIFKLDVFAVGLEGAVVSFVVTGIFYNQLYESWFYTVLLINLLLSIHAKPPGLRRKRKVRRALTAAVR